MSKLYPSAKERYLVLAELPEGQREFIEVYTRKWPALARCNRAAADEDWGPGVFYFVVDEMARRGAPDHWDATGRVLARRTLA